MSVMALAALAGKWSKVRLNKASNPPPFPATCTSTMSTVLSMTSPPQPPNSCIWVCPSKRPSPKSPLSLPTSSRCRAKSAPWPPAHGAMPSFSALRRANFPLVDSLGVQRTVANVLCRSRPCARGSLSCRQPMPTPITLTTIIMTRPLQHSHTKKALIRGFRVHCQNVPQLG